MIGPPPSLRYFSCLFFTPSETQLLGQFSGTRFSSRCRTVRQPVLVLSLNLKALDLRKSRQFAILERAHVGLGRKFRVVRSS